MLADMEYLMHHRIEDFRPGLGDASAQDSAPERRPRVAETFVQATRIYVLRHLSYDRIRRVGPEEGIKYLRLVAFVEREQAADCPVVYFYFAVFHFFYYFCRADRKGVATFPKSEADAEPDRES